MRKKILSILSVIIIFLLSFLLSVFVLFCITKATFFSPDFYINNMQKSDYASQAAEDMNESLVSLGIPGGIPEKVITGVIKNSDVSLELETQIEKHFQGDEYEIRSNSIYERFMGTFSEYAESQGIEVSGEVKSNLEKLAEECVKVYVSRVSFPFISHISDANKVYSRYFIPVAVGLLAVIAVLSVILYFIQRYRHRAFRYYIYALFGSSAICFILPMYLFITKPYQNLLISPEYTKFLIVNMANDFLLILISISIIVFLIAFALLPAYKRFYISACKKVKTSTKEQASKTLYNF